MASIDWDEFSNDTLKILNDIQNDSGKLKRQSLSQIEQSLVDNDEMGVEATKILLSFVTHVANQLRVVDMERINQKTQINTINEEICEIKRRLDKVEK